MEVVRHAGARRPGVDRQRRHQQTLPDDGGQVRRRRRQTLACFSQRFKVTELPTGQSSTHVVAECWSEQRWAEDVGKRMALGTKLLDPSPYSRRYGLSEVELEHVMSVSPPPVPAGTA